jgi:hypothetical protein
MKYALALVALLLTTSARADEPWAFEFELTHILPGTSNRLFYPQCTKVVPVQFIEWYMKDPRKGWEISCGNDQPMFTSWLGRRIGRPLPNLTIEFGWRHLSSPGDQNELEFDSVGVRGRFRWGKR